jgi:3alpha(or 20beta)-hydroxysteroid dehydrogenase
VGKLDGRVAIITGGARGQGEAEARLFASEGATVLVSDVLDDLGRRVAGDLDGRASFRHLDVSDPDEWAAVVASARSQLGRIDILVNNAGIVAHGSIEETSPDDYMRVIRIADLSAYGASKWAVRGMTKTAAVELAPYGIRVNSIHPGVIDTPMGAGSDLSRDQKDALYAHQPVPRVGRPEEVARLVLYMASDDAAYITGSEFVIDGGAIAGPATPVAREG